MLLAALPLALGAAPPDPPAEPSPAESPAPEESSAPEARNIFADIESWTLDNGLRVVFAPIPDDPIASISVTVPSGYLHDPPGREERAHLLEHMLLDVSPDGRSEREFHDEIEQIGGRFNGLTGALTTHYYANVPPQHAATAVDWMYRVIAPKAMSEADLERQREPVALEKDARAWGLWDWLDALYLDPPELRAPGFWRRGYDLPERSERRYQPLESIRAITLEDLNALYLEQYVPGQMTLTLAGDLDRGALAPLVEATFGQLAPGPLPPPTIDPERSLTPHRRVWWGVRSEVQYTRDLRFVDLDGPDYLTAIFLERWLYSRLRRALRRGDEKATYGVSVEIYTTGDALDLEIDLEIDPALFDFAAGVIDGELEALRAGSLPEDEFLEHRALVASQLRARNQEGVNVSWWMRKHLHRRDVFPEVPDLVAVHEQMTRERIADFLARRLPREAEDLALRRPVPMPQGSVGLGAGLAAFVLYAGPMRRWRRPLDMTRIRYVARIQLRVLDRLVLWSALLGLAAAGRLVAWGLQVGYGRWLAPIDRFWLRWGLDATALLALGMAALWLLSRLPRKVLVFEHGIAIKSAWVRTWWIPMEQVIGASRTNTRRALSARAGSALARRLPAILAIGRGVLIEVDGPDQKSWFLRVRAPEEMVSVIRGLSGSVASSSQGAADPEETR